MNLIHLNLSGCFSGLQINKPLGKKQNENQCDLTTLFESIQRSKTLQSVHYSGNSLSKASINKIK